MSINTPLSTQMVSSTSYFYSPLFEVRELSCTSDGTSKKNGCYTFLGKDGNDLSLFSPSDKIHSGIDGFLQKICLINKNSLTRYLKKDILVLLDKNKALFEQVHCAHNMLYEYKLDSSSPGFFTQSFSNGELECENNFFTIGNWFPGCLVVKLYLVLVVLLELLFSLLPLITTRCY